MPGFIIPACTVLFFTTYSRNIWLTANVFLFVYPLGNTVVTARFCIVNVNIANGCIVKYRVQLFP